MSEESDKVDDLDRVKKACQVLGEYFDTVQIFTTRHEAFTHDGTVNVSYGEGNWFTRFGQVSEWIIRQDARTRKFVQDEDSK